LETFMRVFDGRQIHRKFANLATLLFGTIAICSVVIARAQGTRGLSPSPAGAEAFFIDLKDGATVPAQLRVYFGLRNMGVAPASSDLPNTGHHHLLIDTELPALNQPIPNDFNHLHFGGGQTETELTLKPGKHTLQLLMGDKDHIPHTPPVMSARIQVNVPLTGGPTPSPPGAEVYFDDLKDGATIPSRLTVHFGLRNMGVAPAGTDRQNSGHHHLLIDADLPPLDQPIPNDFNHLHFGGGQTETELALKPGEHTLQLLMGDKDHIPHTPPVMSSRIKVRVAGLPANQPAQLAPQNLRELDMDTVPNLTENNIRQVQQELRRKGFDPGPIDGIHGPRTKEAVRNFQDRYGMNASGDINNKTLFALGAVELARPKSQ
jgi:Domain of unknown function (DUF4399)/Putative peptidoglycan binding domain